MAAISPEQIDRWRSTPTEHQKLEFKAARSNYDFEKLCQYCVALANEGGGHLLLGIEDKLPRPIIGSTAFPNPAKTEAQLFEILRFRITVDEVIHPDGRVVVFSVPSRPVGSVYSFKGQYLMRAGDSLVPMSEDRLRQIFNEGKLDWLSESAAVDVDDQTVVDLLDTQTFFELTKAPYPTTRDAVLEALDGAGLIESRKTGNTISRLGAILLAKRLPDFTDLEFKAPRVVVYGGKSKETLVLDRDIFKGYAVGFHDLVKFTCGLLPQNEVIKGAFRKSTKLVPEEVVRELIANALIHQDFTETGTRVLIEIYTNRVEISNPGEPVIQVERFIDDNRSRNEKLVSLMRKMRVCEELGGGIDSVIRQVEVYQLPAPDFSSGLRHTRVIIFGSRDFWKMTMDERIRACYQHCCLKRVMFQPMTNQTLRERFGLPEKSMASVSLVIKNTVDTELIRLDDGAGGSRRFARYVPFWA